MKTLSTSSHLKTLLVSSFVLVIAAFWAGSGVAGKLSGSTVEAPAIKSGVQDKSAEQDLREKVFLHRLSLGAPGPMFART